MLPADQRKAFLTDRTCAIVGRQTADRFGFKVGDRVPIQATIWRKKGGSSSWEFNICGIFDGDKKGVDTTPFFFNYDYFDEARQFGQGLVGWYVIRINDPAKAPEIAERIDAMFANSFAETKTTTEKAFLQAFAKQIGDIGLIIRGIVTAVFFTILLVAANTMGQSVRERTSELAVLKTLGFSDAVVLALVLAESCAIALVGRAERARPRVAAHAGRRPDQRHAAGLLSADGRPGPRRALRPRRWACSPGIMPAVQAMRLRIVDALRRT